MLKIVMEMDFFIGKIPNFLTREKKNPNILVRTTLVLTPQSIECMLLFYTQGNMH